MRYELATNDQLKAIMNYDRECPVNLLRQAVNEMIERGLLKKFIQYHSKHVFGVVKSKQIKLGLEDSDIIQLGYIGILKALEKFQEGKSSFSTFSVLYMRSEWQNHMNRFNTEKRTMDREGISIDTVINEEGNTVEDLLPSMVDVEKTVLMKIFLESQLRLLTPLQRTAVVGQLKGYQNKEVAKFLNSSRQNVDKAFKQAMKKLGIEGYSLKENCGMRRKEA